MQPQVQARRKPGAGVERHDDEPRDVALPPIPRGPDQLGGLVPRQGALLGLWLGGRVALGEAVR